MPCVGSGCRIRQIGNVVTILINCVFFGFTSAPNIQLAHVGVLAIVSLQVINENVSNPVHKRSFFW